MGRRYGSREARRKHRAIRALARTPPEAAAARILRGVERREPRILIGLDAFQIDVLQRPRPASYWKSLARKLEDPNMRKQPATVKQPSH